MDTDSAPRFRRNPQGELLWRPSPAAQRSRPLKTGPASSALAVEREALRAVRQKHLPTEDKVLVLGHHCLQFGKYQGHSFKWLLENALGYAAWVVADMASEKPTDAPLSRNKFKLKVRSHICFCFSIIWKCDTCLCIMYIMYLIYFQFRQSCKLTT